MSQSARIFFKTHFDARPGECIVLVGNCEPLGNWDVTRGHRLIPKGEGWWSRFVTIRFTFPFWLHYKLVLCKEPPSGPRQALRWEKELIPDSNRSLRLISEMVCQVDMQWDDLRFRQSPFLSISELPVEPAVRHFALAAQSCCESTSKAATSG